MEGWRNGTHYRGPPTIWCAPRSFRHAPSSSRASVEAVEEEAERKDTQGLGLPAADRAPAELLAPARPRLPRPTNNAPARTALTTQVSAPSAPAKLDLAMAAPPAQVRGCSRSGAAGPPLALTAVRRAPALLAAPHRGPEPPRRPRHPPPSNSSAEPGPSARPRVRKGWRYGAASRGPRGRWGSRMRQRGAAGAAAGGLGAQSRSPDTTEALLLLTPPRPQSPLR